MTYPALQNMIDTIFNVPEFKDQFFPLVQSSSSSGSSSSSLAGITCIQYEREYNPLYTQYGLDDGIDFVITCKVADFTPQKGMKILYHNKPYKIASWKEDGYNLTWNINLKSLASK